MSGDHILDAVPPGKLVQREVWIPERHVDQPGWTVHNDRLHRLPGMGFQVRFQENQFLGRQFLGPAIVEDREMRPSVIETVVPGVRGVLLEQPLRCRRPDVVVAGREIEWIAPEKPENPAGLQPLRLRGGVVHPLDGVTHSRPRTRGFRPPVPSTPVRRRPFGPLQSGRPESRSGRNRAPGLPRHTVEG